jgi:hypothetical protein
MIGLLEFQRTMARAVMQPMSGRDTMKHEAYYEANRETYCENRDAVALVKPNSRLSSVERLDIYRRSYWSRVLDAFSEDFPGVRALLGAKRFDRLRLRYMADCPSESFTMRNLGKHLTAWMERNPTLAGANYGIALDMARLEWAQVESFDAAEHKPLSPADVAALTPESRLRLQPHLRLIEVWHEVDALLIAVRQAAQRNGGRRRGAGQKRIAGAKSAALSAALSANTAAISVPVYLAVHRFELVVHYKRLDAEKFRLMSALAKGECIADAAEIAYGESPLTAEECQQHIQRSFALFAALGWFCTPGQLENEEGS